MSLFGETFIFENGVSTELDLSASGPSDSNPPSNTGSSNTGGGGGGGGGSSNNRDSSSVCVENWKCTDWSDLTGACGTRTCTDTKKCGTTKLKPTEKRDCKEETEKSVIETTTGQDTGFFSGLTGAVTGVLATGKGIIALAFIIFMVGMAITVFMVRKKKKAK